MWFIFLSKQFSFRLQNINANCFVPHDVHTESMTKHVMMRITVVKRERESTFSRNVWFFFFFHCCVVPSIWRHTERNTHLFDLRDPVCALSISLALQRVEWHSNRWKIFYASWKWINKDLFARYQHKKHGKRVYVIDAHHTHVNVNWSVYRQNSCEIVIFFIYLSNSWRHLVLGLWSVWFERRWIKK